MRLHELPLVCARLTCGSDLNTWVCISSFVICAQRLKSLIICQCEGTFHDNYHHDDKPMLSQIPIRGADGSGAGECARTAENCLRQRGGAMEIICWRDAQDDWRL